MLNDPFSDLFCGLQVTTNPHMTERIQTKFPRSKKRRIRKKWSKNQKNWTTRPVDKVYQMGNTLIMHPEIFERLRREVKDIYPKNMR